MEINREINITLDDTILLFNGLIYLANRQLSYDITNDQFNQIHFKWTNIYKILSRLWFLRTNRKVFFCSFYFLVIDSSSIDIGSNEFVSNVLSDLPIPPLIHSLISFGWTVCFLLISYNPLYSIYKFTEFVRTRFINTASILYKTILLVLVFLETGIPNIFVNKTIQIEINIF